MPLQSCTILSPTCLMCLRTNKGRAVFLRLKNSLSSVYTPAFITVVALYNPEHKCKETILSTFRESGRRLVSISYLILFCFFSGKDGNPKFGCAFCLQWDIWCYYRCRVKSWKLWELLWKSKRLNSKKLWPFYRAFLCSLNIPVQSFERCCHENDM